MVEHRAFGIYGGENFNQSGLTLYSSTGRYVTGGDEFRQQVCSVGIHTQNSNSAFCDGGVHGIVVGSDRIGIFKLLVMSATVKRQHYFSW